MTRWKRESLPKSVVERIRNLMEINHEPMGNGYTVWLLNEVAWYRKYLKTLEKPWYFEARRLNFLYCKKLIERSQNRKRIPLP